MMECKRIHPDSEPYLNYNLDNNLWDLAAFYKQQKFSHLAFELSVFVFAIMVLWSFRVSDKPLEGMFGN